MKCTNLITRDGKLESCNSEKGVTIQGGYCTACKNITADPKKRRKLPIAEIQSRLMAMAAEKRREREAKYGKGSDPSFSSEVKRNLF